MSLSLDLERNIVSVNFFLRILNGASAFFAIFFFFLYFFAYRAIGRLTDFSRLDKITFITPRTKLEAFGDNFSAIFFLASGFIIPASSLNPAFHKNAFPFFQILGGNLGLSAKYHNIMKIHRFLLDAGLIFPNAIGGNGEPRYLLARWQGPHFRVASQVAKNKRFVDIHMILFYH